MMQDGPSSLSSLSSPDFDSERDSDWLMGIERELSSRSEPYVHRYKAGKTLTFDQESILREYYQRHLQNAFSYFITCAPKEPLNFRALRAFLILSAVDTPVVHYKALIDKYYPVIEPEDPTFVQNKYFRELLAGFNQLCRNEININHPLYINIFDPRLHDSRLNSPTKRNLVTKSLKSLTEREVHHLVPTPTMESDLLVDEAKRWLADKIWNQAASTEATIRPVSRRLFFGDA